MAIIMRHGSDAVFLHSIGLVKTRRNRRLFSLVHKVGQGSAQQTGKQMSRLGIEAVAKHGVVPPLPLLTKTTANCTRQSTRTQRETLRAAGPLPPSLKRRKTQIFDRSY